MGALENAKVTLYLDDKSEPIAQADVQSDGSYVLEFTPEVYENIVKNNYALLSADGTKKSFKSIVAFYDSNSSGEYSYKDTIISEDTQIIYELKSALKFDKNSTKKVVNTFLEDYENGIYKTTTPNAYKFALHDIFLETKKKKLSKNEILEKLSIVGLKKDAIIEAKKNKATTYAFTSAKVFNNLVVTHFISFNIENSQIGNSDISFERELKAKSKYYDSAKLYSFTFDNIDVKLKKVKINTFESNDTLTLTGYMEHNEFSNQKTSQIVKNKKLPSLGVKVSKVESKSNKTISYKQHQSTLDNVMASSAKTSDSLVIDIFTHYKEDLWYYCGTQYDSIDTSSCLDYNVDKHVAVQYNFFYQGVFLNTEYDFIDNDNLYTPDSWTVTYSKSTETYQKANGTYVSKVTGASNDLIAFKQLSETVYQGNGTSGIDSKHSDNTYFNAEERDMITTYKLTNDNIVTHTIRDFDKYLSKLKTNIDDENTVYWKNSDYSQNISPYLANNDYDGRIPLLLIHGWQGDSGLTNSAVLLEYKNNEFSYWHNFLSYYLATPEIYNKYRLYLYHYPSYKHITDVTHTSTPSAEKRHSSWQKHKF